MAASIRAAMIFALSNYSLTFLILGLIFAIIAIFRARKSLEPSGVVERLLAWHVFWSIGFGYLYNFVMHGFFGKMSAAFIGWADSPFQFEVATASLGFAAVGFLAAFRSFDLRLAAIVGPAVFTLGAAVGHLYQMATEHTWTSLFRHSGRCCYCFSIATDIPPLGRYRHSPRLDRKMDPSATSLEYLCRRSRL
jgi:hypothetical protein